LLINELYRKGLDSKIVENLYDLRKGAALIVYQNGIMSFATYHGRFVDVAATQIINGTGNTDIVVKKNGINISPFTEELSLVELHKQINSSNNTCGIVSSLKLLTALEYTQQR
jgi:hypothetical protein